MSFDRQIDQVCPHFVYDETLFVMADQQTIRPLRPIASTDSVTVRLNGEITIPSYGVNIPASSSGTRQGPFTIVSGVNDTLALRVGGGPTQTAVFPATNRMATSRLVGLLNRAFQGVSYSVVDNRVAFQTGLEGPAATLFVESGSTLASLLGIPTNRQFRGKRTAPGWSLVQASNTLTDRPKRFVVFDVPLRGMNDYVEISYSTIRQECRRCGGIGIEHDWRYGGQGDTGEVRDEALLIQELQKVMYTALGSNPFHSWYGTTLLETVGKKLSASGLVQSLIVSDIQHAFSRWQSIKRQQEQAVGQIVSDREFPFNLLAVNLEQSTKDPTVVFVKVTVQNRSFQPIQLERGLRLPMPLDILGSTAQQGAMRQSLSNFVLTG